jgi:hypothetical protein
MRGVRRFRRELEREASEPLPDPWRLAAEAIRGEIARREGERRRGLRAVPVPERDAEGDR